MTLPAPARLLLLPCAILLAGTLAARAPLTLKVVPAWAVQGELEGSLFGARAMTAGDVYHDGYSDLMIGAPQWSHGRGKAYLYRGSAQGLTQTPAWTAQGEAAGELFGDRVGQAGDLNGDGFADVFVAAPAWRAGLGRLTVFYGSAQGLAAAPDLSLPGGGGEQFGDCTHPVGDLDGDGFDDLAVGAYGYDHARGRLLLFRGGPRGLSPSAAWEGQGEGPGDWYGYGVGAAGDVNGDGIVDLLTGGKYLGVKGKPAVGRVYLHYGTRQGLLAPPVWTYTGTVTEANVGVRVTGAGDLDGDGFADVLVTAPGANGKLGQAMIFKGSPHGLKAKPDLVLRGRDYGLQFFGQGACPAGDVDGDGYDDLAIAGRDALGRGKVLVFRGGPRGVQAQPTWEIDGESGGDRFGWWVAPAGDLDGDGLADLVISADSHGNGKVYVVYGRQFRQALGSHAALRSTKVPDMNGYLWVAKPKTKKFR